MVVNKEIVSYFIFSEIVQSESLNDYIQQKLTHMMEWLSEIDVEAVQLNGLIFINTVSGDTLSMSSLPTVDIVQVANCVTNQGDQAVGVGPLVDIILNKIHGDEFWVILEDLVVSVVNQR